MKHRLRPLLTLWGNALGVAGVVEDVTATVRSHRQAKARTEELVSAERTQALTKAREGCTHMPLCPSASAPDRTEAVEVWADDACVYLCNGLVLSTKAIKAPDSPSGLYTPEKETL